SSEEIHARVGRQLAEAASVYSVDAELLESLRPTHIVTQVHCEVCAVSLGDVRAAVHGSATAAAEIVALGASTLAQALEDMERVAASLAVPARGTGVTSRLRARMNGIAAAAAPLPRPRVLTIEWLAPLMAAGNWIPQMIEMAGGENLAGETGRHSPWLETGALDALDPDVIAVFPCGFSLERTESEMRRLAEASGLAGTRAALEGRLFLADGNQFFNRPGPRLVESLEMFAEMLHPEKFDFGHGRTSWRPWPAAD
ncbi:MAG TPA: cobalamin-binding protein, partial [Thermoanaerobaculia bacterium]|nr:cobalamin-binding protein [Thermoanaerobaculia bacterium]